MQKPLLKYMKIAVVIFVFAVIGCYLWAGGKPPAKPEKQAEPAAAEPQSPTVEGKVYRGCLADSGFVKANQRFSDILRDYKLEDAVWKELNLLPRRIFSFTSIRPGQKYTVIYKSDSVKTANCMFFECSPYCGYLFHFSSPLKVEKIERQTEVEERVITAEIKRNLWETIEAMNIPAALCNKFVDIFDWRVDFQRLQAGDRLKIIYTQQSAGGKYVSFDQIKAACFEHGDKTLYAFGYQKDGNLKYYDENGASCQAQLLRYPIEFSRISSRYSPRRFHPVAKVFRPHLGTDFAAPAGTPIRTVGDGVVAEAGHKLNNGNYVKIAHNQNYATGYLHMSRIGHAIRPGARVKQGQVIGYVGSTGLATGPHLCYRFWKNGKQVDALRAGLPLQENLSKSEFEDFERSKTALASRLELAPFPAQTTQVAHKQGKAVSDSSAQNF